MMLEQICLYKTEIFLSLYKKEQTETNQTKSSDSVKDFVWYLSTEEGKFLTL